MELSLFDYELPPELIAQSPAEPRDSSRLMVINRKSGEIFDRVFGDIGEYVIKGDVLVFNQTKVFPARLFGQKITGGKVEVLVVKLHSGSNSTEFIGRNIGTSREVRFGAGLEGKIVRPGVMEFNFSGPELLEKFNEIGYTPLPPYIQPKEQSEEPNIRRKYQTVYAREIGSAAAPTAGFHFTESLLEKLKESGVIIEFVTLHVGLGTFLPVKTSRVEDHKMHAEEYEITLEVEKRLKEYKEQGRRVIAVGTTSVRTLESWIRTGVAKGETDIFITPGFEFKFVDNLITNFHLPKSTLLMLVSAMAGRELILKAYIHAIEKKYRFFSFGDAMLIQ